MPLPTVLGTAHTGTSSSTTSHGVTMPSTVNSGDLLLMHFVVNGNITFTTPSGWSIVVARATSSFNFQSTITYGKVADGTEDGASVTVTTSGSCKSDAQVWRIGTWHGTLADDVIGLTGTYFNTTTANPPSRSWTWGTDDELAIAIAAGTHTHTVSSYPTNYSGNQQDTDCGDTTVGIGSATRNLINTASPEDPGAFTLSSNGTGVVTTIVIRGLDATGTIAATLRKAVFSGSGVMVPKGTIVATLRKATASLTGAQTIPGAVAATMQKATFAGAGSQAGGTEGTIAATMQRATASASGAMEPSGAIAATQQKATFSGAGAQAQTGAIAATQQKATFAGTGAQALTGAIAATLQQAVFASSGKTGPAGTIAATITKATAAFAGVMQPSGQIAATMQRARFAASGSHIISGTLAATARKLTFAGTGAHILSGAMAATMQRTRFAGVGHFDNAGAALVSIAKNFLVRVGILKRHEVEIDVARKYNVALSFESSDGVAVAVARTYEVEIIMSNETCYVGNSITATGRFTLVSSGALTDPTTITATVQIPGGTKTTYTYGVDSEMGKTSTGIYTCTFTPSSAGKWIVKFTGAGAVVAVNQEDFTVLTAI